MNMSCITGCGSGSALQEEVESELHSIHIGQTQPAAAQLTNRGTQILMPYTVNRDSTNVGLTIIVEDHTAGAPDGLTDLLESGQACGKTYEPEVAIAAKSDSVARINAAGEDPNWPGRDQPLPELLVIGRQLAAAPLQSLAVAAAVDIVDHGPAALPNQALPAGQMPVGIVGFHEEPADGAGQDLIPPGDVDLGWGIVVGVLSRADFNEILAFPLIYDE